MKFLNSMKSLAFALGISAVASGVLAQEVNFGIIATDSASVQRERWEPFFAEMQKRRGSPSVRFMHPTTRV